MANIFAWQFVFLPGSACKLLLEFEELHIYDSSTSNVSLTFFTFSDSAAFSTSSVLLFISWFVLSSASLIMSYVSLLTFETFLFYWVSRCVHHLTTFVLRVFVSFKIVENFGIILTFITWLELWFYFILFFFLVNILLRILSWISYTFCLISGLLSFSIASYSSPLTSFFKMSFIIV